MKGNKMNKMRLLLKTIIVFAVVLVFITPESAIMTDDRIFDINTKNIFDDAIQTILVDNTPPSIIINFAGNLGDKGGPYWQPPGESICLMNHTVDEWRDGYYTNDSRQQENWIYINLTVNDSGGVAEVWLHWYDATIGIWTNHSYPFVHTRGDFWELNTSDMITDIIAGHDYSFDVFAIDTYNNSNLICWKKTGLDGGYTRRYVQLHCTPIEIIYHPFYLREYTSETGIYTHPPRFQHDRLHHDQGPADTNTDTGYLNSTEPQKDIEMRYCTTVVAYWFEDNTCIPSFNLTNLYFRYWYITPNDGLRCTAAGLSRKAPGGDIVGSYRPPDKNGSRSHIGTEYGTSYLDTNLLPIDSSFFTENNLYELCIFINHFACGPPIRVLSNRSFMSFILLNVPNNQTLITLDSDNDSLSDWTELYVTYTSPFHIDTDDDGASDWEELNAEQFGYNKSDPNNYTDTTLYRYDLTAYAGGPYIDAVNHSIQFWGLAVGGQPPYRYLWDFGDGNTSNLSNPTHSYQEFGIYTVNLTVFDSEMNWSYDVTMATIQYPLVWVDDEFNEMTPGWNQTHFNSIQTGINNVLPNGQVIVYDGIYRENIVITKPLTLQGIDLNTTIIDGNNSGNVIVIRADNVNITRLTILGHPCIRSIYHGIVVNADQIVLEDNIIRNSRFSIFLKEDTSVNVVRKNMIIDNERGIYLRCSSDNIITQNEIKNDHTYAIYLEGAANKNVIDENDLMNNQHGIYIRYILPNPPTGNVVYHNNFINNTQQAYDRGNNFWNGVYPAGGNYWDDFDEPSEGAYDNNSDGTVDSPYVISSGVNQDHYPFIVKDGWLHPPGDLDGDGDVDLMDLVQLLVNYGTTSGATYEMGDIDGDGDVDLSDLAILLSNYGYGT